ncbi:hypothetical protein L1987_10941 [Smallanthus sonchifolius]|uniref:Uncharacterized protein n=1 Tax=Smallanthus sonchifolius TaxID=185202 RepID=A0ACB9JD02_9ASTR|nr:hypothetical protein L1987_10941 [Smallanthus sonchifolius]
MDRNFWMLHLDNKKRIFFLPTTCISVEIVVAMNFEAWSKQTSFKSCVCECSILRLFKIYKIRFACRLVLTDVEHVGYNTIVLVFIVYLS